MLLYVNYSLWTAMISAFATVCQISLPLMIVHVLDVL
jgi:hypothetical protein